jgi:hypothetical protein
MASPGPAATSPPATASRPSLAFAATNPSVEGAYAIISPFLVTPEILEKTRSRNASGNSNNVSNRGAA